MPSFTKLSTVKSTFLLSNRNAAFFTSLAGSRAANWSAHRILKAHQEFQWDVVKTLEDTPIYFTGEMVAIGIL
jgi:hypothetical protein